MMYDEFKRAVIDNWWCKGSPLAWMSENPGIGIGLMAADGRVGQFNLCWLMLQRTDPPPLKVYQQTNMRWVFTHAEQIFVRGHSLLEHASFKTLDEFNALILSYSKERRLVNIEGGVPWGTLQTIAEKSFSRG